MKRNIFNNITRSVLAIATALLGACTESVDMPQQPAAEPGIAMKDGKIILNATLDVSNMASV